MTDCERIEVFRKVLIGEYPAGPCVLMGIMEVLVLYRSMNQEDLESLAKESTERRFVAILCRRCRKDRQRTAMKAHCRPCTVFCARQRLGSVCKGREMSLQIGYTGWLLKPPEAGA